MNPASRRSFLTLAGAGAATVAAATVAAAAPASAAPAAAAPTPLPPDAEGPLVAHVKDVQHGVVTVMVSGASVDVTDHELVARLAQAARAAKV